MLMFAKQVYHLLGAFKNGFSTDHIKNSPEGNSIAIVLGNGPSLKGDLSKIQDLVKSHELVDLYCVNSFPTTDYFHKLKPNNLVLADPGLWKNEVKGEFREFQDNLFAALKKSEHLHVLNIYLPMAARFEKKTLSKYRDIKNTKIFFYNSNSWKSSFKSLLYKRNWAMPILQNVLVGALYIPLFRGSKKVYLFGADHSWHKNMVLGSDNVLRFEYEHFFGEKKLKPFFKDTELKSVFTIKEYFKVMYLEYKAFDELQAFARLIDVQIINATSDTFVDSFQRVDLTL